MIIIMGYFITCKCLRDLQVIKYPALRLGSFLATASIPDQGERAPQVRIDGNPCGFGGDAPSSLPLRYRNRREPPWR
jgi:hypothetical protein